jgi:DNA-directed RNA polymerase subunit RPC12/RpoP
MADAERALGTRIAVAAVVLTVICAAAWFMHRRAQAGSGEQDMELTMICAACGHTFGTTYAKMPELVTAARARGFPQIGSDMNGPVGVCPSCGKPAVFRSSRCPHCGKPVVYDGVILDGKRIRAECRECGWKAEQRNAR